MTGSNIFSFASTRRKSKPLRENISDPLTPAEIKYMEARAVDDASRSPHSARNRRVEHRTTSGPTLASISTYDAENKYSLLTAASRECLRKSSTRPDRPAASRAVSNPHPNRLRKEQSSSTLRSYYDRKQLPFAVSQQTSASSARDFALRKGYPPVIPTLHRDVSCPQNSDFTTLTNRGAPKKRPSRLDFSMLFPKPLPQSGPMLSPQRYTDSPPPLSATSELPFKGLQPQSFLYDKKAIKTQEPSAPRHTQATHRQPKKMDPTFAKINVQKPRGGVHNWFDGLEGNISEDDDDREPDMQPDFVETTFQTASPQTKLDTAVQATYQPEKSVWPNYGADHQSPAASKNSGSRKVTPVEDSRLREALHKWEAEASIATGGKSSQVGHSPRSASTVLDLTDLHEESVLCLSSSEDEEDDNMRKGHQRPIFEQRGPFLRDSLGVDSIDSDVEIGTAQAVNTSFLRTIKPPAQPSNLRDKSSKKTQSKAQKPKAFEIPDRHSSRQGASRDDPRMALSTSDNGNLGAFSVDQAGQQSPSSGRSTRTAPAATQCHSTLMMALTPQEAALLEAMRSKRASMRHNTRSETRHVAADDESPSQSPSALQSSVDHDFQSRCSGNRPVHRDTHLLELKKNYPTNPPSTEPSVPSGRVSLIFSESVSSPTTGRDSPATPTLDSNQDLNPLHGLGEFHDPDLHTVEANRFGHTRCRTGSNQIIVLDNFQQPEKESVSSDGYSWMISQFNQRNS